MTSVFNGWMAHQIVGPLNKAEVRNALLDYNIERLRFRTWDTIEVLILESSDEVKNVVYQCGQAKQIVEDEHRITGLKRRQEMQSWIEMFDGE